MYHTAYTTARAYTIPQRIPPRRLNPAGAPGYTVLHAPLHLLPSSILTSWYLLRAPGTRAPGILPPAYIISPHTLLRRILFGPGGRAPGYSMPAYTMQRAVSRPGAPVPERSSCYTPPTHIIVVAYTAARAYYPIAYTVPAYTAPLDLTPRELPQGAPKYSCTPRKTGM